MENLPDWDWFSAWCLTLAVVLRGVVMSLILLIVVLLVYVYLGDKANEFCKRHICHVETVLVFDVSTWIQNRAIWGFLLGWLTIPIALIMWIFGVRD